MLEPTARNPRRTTGVRPALSGHVRRGIVCVSLLVSSLATAEPPEGAFADSHLECILRLGATWVSTDDNLGIGPNPKGVGTALDAELAWRAPHVSLSVFSTLSTLRIRTDTNDQEEDVMADARFTLVDLGWRVSLFSGSGTGPFIGLGVAAEVTRESGRRTACQCANNYCSPCTSLYSDRPYTNWNLAPLVEVHVGVSLPRTGPFSLELLALVGMSTNPDGYDIDFWSLTTERLAIGGRF